MAIVFGARECDLDQADTVAARVGSRAATKDADDVGRHLRRRRRLAIDLLFDGIQLVPHDKDAARLGNRRATQTHDRGRDNDLRRGASTTCRRAGLTGSRRSDGAKQFGDDGHQILHPSRRRIHNDYTERETGAVLLVLDVPIHRDEDVAHIAGTSQERAVLGSRPQLSSQFTARAFVIRQWHPNPGGDESCFRYRQNVITGAVMVIVGVFWSVVLATRYCRNEVRAFEPEPALAQNR